MSELSLHTATNRKAKGPIHPFGRLSIGLAAVVQLIMGAWMVLVGPGFWGWFFESSMIAEHFWLILGAVMSLAILSGTYLWKPLRLWGMGLFGIFANLGGLILVGYMVLSSSLNGFAFLFVGVVFLTGLFGFAFSFYPVYQRRESLNIQDQYRTENTSSGFLGNYQTTDGENLLALSQQQPILLVFLRHFGCTFCREAMADVRAQQAEIERQGIRIIMVHLADPAIAQKYLDKYGIGDLSQVSDPEGGLYEAMELQRGNFKQLFGLKSWIEGLRAGILRGFGVGTHQIGDGFRMSGVFLVKQGRVVRSFRHDSAADRPDYVEVCELNA